METPADLITRFYKAFQERDAEGMAACYADNVVFFDPAFELLQANEAKAMWRMLCQNAKDFSLSFGNIQDLGDGYHTCDWVASYTFSGTGR
ncbi:MAG: nuclear transport factor 2 family protein, partial [Chitinophagaceae bacterium]